MSVVLRSSQDGLIDGLRDSYTRVRRVCAQASCGFGKTHVGCAIAQKADARGTSTLIIAHRRRLIQQWSERLDMFGVPHGIIMANATDELLRRHTPGARVQVASKDTLISRIEREGIPQAGFVIIDEAHNILGNEYTNLLNHYRDARWLGLTATPVTGNGRGLGGYFDELVCAPPTSQLITEGVIVPFRVYAALDMKDIRKSGGKIKPAGDPVEQWKRYARGLPTVLFAPKVNDSKSVAKSFCAAGIPAVHIDAHSSEADREAAADGLASGAVKVVCQCGLYTEGVDIPCVAVVQLLAKCGSLVKFIQAVWRAGRSFAGKEYAIVIDHTGAVFEHGFPDEDMEWTLTPGDPIKHAAGDSTAREPFICSKCGLCYSGSLKCPGCGSELAINRKMYQPELFGHLVEVERDFAASVSNESNQRAWTSVLFQCARGGLKCKAAAARFHARTGLWPNQTNVTPVPDRNDNNELVIDVFPQFGAKAKTRQEAGGLFV